MAKPKVAAIIQARMGSTRLPGKVLMPLAGKPVLWHIVHRLRKCRMVDVVAIATSAGIQDDLLALWATEAGIPLIRGPEDNVLERYLLAARQLNADIVVRVTGDAPLVDSALIDHMIELLIEKNADYCTGEPGVLAIHEGFAPLTRKALEKIGKEGASEPAGREHVDGYIKQHPEQFSIVHVPIPQAHRIAGTRVSVDTPADLEFLGLLYHELGADAGELDVAEAVALLKRRPELLSINAHVQQKDMTAANKLVVIRCDGHPEIGLGHVVRCLAIARSLRDRQGIGIVFAMAERSPGPDMVREAGFPIELFDGKRNEFLWLEELLARRCANGLLLDIRTDLAAAPIRDWRRKGVHIAVLDDGSERRLCADLAFYPPVPQVNEMDWTDFTGNRLIGWEWIPLSAGFDRKLLPPENQIPQVVITMGGSDPAGLSLRGLNALQRLDVPVNARLILGRSFAHGSQLAQLLPNLDIPVTILENVSNMPEALADADLVVASFGVTAYEMAALGIPTILLSLTDDHARSASALHQAGMALSLGNHVDVTEGQLADDIRNLLIDPKALSTMRDASAHIDGKGAGRIADRLNESLSEQLVKQQRSSK
ncbi:spore coat polysaccharide biosynthesis protein SpsF [Geoalkalibacter ferrihydriticus]|uniref:Spore coat polysaccharide biosynthesis protein SpsF n=1 Tax=Geoalkalibacter ferrihydriticus TaxID=392333 RepID=A0A1G9VTT4_9BACT|nr:NTP transferase domain-containing protein [Geoalkalibacter ferrihydriticus]SDM75381.1 spore coat polysaccharide biosynthesis protein SpsF [Geoalkalibacter ferrihydriticus]